MGAGGRRPPERLWGRRNGTDVLEHMENVMGRPLAEMLKLLENTNDES